MTRPGRCADVCYLPMNQPIFHLIAHDRTGGRANWSQMAMIHFTGTLAASEEDPATVSDQQISEIYAFLAAYGIRVRPAGNDGAGQPFAEEPWLQWYPNHILFTQCGGLDI